MFHKRAIIALFVKHCRPLASLLLKNIALNFGYRTYLEYTCFLMEHRAMLYHSEAHSE